MKNQVYLCPKDYSREKRYKHVMDGLYFDASNGILYLENENNILDIMNFYVEKDCISHPKYINTLLCYIIGDIKTEQYITNEEKCIAIQYKDIRKLQLINSKGGNTFYKITKDGLCVYSQGDEYIENSISIVFACYDWFKENMDLRKIAICYLQGLDVISRELYSKIKNIIFDCYPLIVFISDIVTFSSNPNALKIIFIGNKNTSALSTGDEDEMRDEIIKTGVSFFDNFGNIDKSGKIEYI